MTDFDWQYDPDAESDDERRSEGEPICRTCEHRYRRVVKDGECEDCWLAREDSRCEARNQ